MYNRTIYHFRVSSTGNTALKKSKLSKKSLVAVICVAAAALVVTALLIINIFFPIRYISSWFVSGKKPAEDSFQLRVLDVGNADCAIASLPGGKVMLIDGGDGTYTSTLKILTELNRIDADFIDYVICTSVSSEHCGGLAEIIGVKGAGKIYYPYCENRYINSSYAEFMTAAQSCGAQLAISEYGAGEESGDFFFTFLSPDVHTAPGGEYEALNDDNSQENIDAASAVIWMEYEGRGVLYASDATNTVLNKLADEYQLLTSSGEGLSFRDHEIDFSDCAIYKVAGHGSEGCHSQPLLSLISPDISVISVGEDNTYGCPSAQVMADLVACSRMYITMYRGDITMEISRSGDVTLVASRGE